MLLDRRFRHSEGIMSALIVVMAQDGTAHDWKIRIGTDKIMRKQLNEIEQLDKSRPLNLHGNMFKVKDNAMFIVIYIRRILESPVGAVDLQRNDPVILSCRMIDSSCISDIFLAEQALGISALFCKLRRRDGFRILFRLGEIDGNINVSIRTGHAPPHILFDPVTADVVGILTQLVEIIRCFHRAFLIQLPEFRRHLRRSRHQAVHQLRVEQIPVNNAVMLHQPLFGCIIKKLIQRLLQIRMLRHLLLFLIIIQFQDLQNPVDRVDPVFFLQKSLLHPILYKFCDTFFYHNFLLPDALAASSR